MCFLKGRAYFSATSRILLYCNEKENVGRPFLLKVVALPNTFLSFVTLFLSRSHQTHHSFRKRLSRYQSLFELSKMTLKSRLFSFIASKTSTCSQYCLLLDQIEDNGIFGCLRFCRPLTVKCWLQLDTNSCGVPCVSGICNKYVTCGSTARADL